jgi:hypothetical protein
MARTGGEEATSQAEEKPLFPYSTRKPNVKPPSNKTASQPPETKRRIEGSGEVFRSDNDDLKAETKTLKVQWEAVNKEMNC